LRLGRPSLAALCEDLGISRRTLRRRIHGLRDRFEGWLESQAGEG